MRTRGAILPANLALDIAGGWSIACAILVLDSAALGAAAVNVHEEVNHESALHFCPS
jgi:hypothetical protein